MLFPRKMFRRKMIAALAVLAATVGVSATGRAQAATFDKDELRMSSADGNFHFGGEDGTDFAYGDPDDPGYITWNYSNGQVSAHLAGALHLVDVVGQCARMRLNYFDAAGNALATKFGGTVCAPDNTRHWWLVDLNPYASNEIAEMKVSIEKQTVLGGAFSTAISSVHHPNPHGDSVKITATGFDFGDEKWGIGGPLGSGTVWWRLEDGQWTPHLTGTLHLNNVDGGCARMNIRYLSESGSFLTSRAGGVVCASDNGHHEFTVDLEPYTSNKIGQVNVQLQSQNTNGTFTVIGSSTVTVSDRTY